MLVSHWMSPDPVCVNPNTTVREARRLLRYYGIRHLPVVAANRVVGMLSDRDVSIDDARLSSLSSVQEVGSLLGSRQLVEAVMSSPPYTITAGETVEAAARTMLSRRISALPVLDAHDHLIGMITTTDCLLASMTPPVEAAETAVT